MSEKFAVDKIHCANCASKITKAIAEAQPGARVEVDIKHGIVTVEPVSDRNTIVHAIESAGYSINRAA